MSQKRGVIALDVGGSKTACGLFLEGGELLFQRNVATIRRVGTGFWITSLGCAAIIVLQAVIRLRAEAAKSNCSER